VAAAAIAAAAAAAAVLLVVPAVGLALKEAAAVRRLRVWWTRRCFQT